MIKKLFISFSLIGLSACAGVQLPTDRLERSAANIRGAEEGGAVGVPGAKLHLQLAKEERQKALQEGMAKHLEGTLPPTRRWQRSPNCRLTIDK